MTFGIPDTNNKSISYPGSSQESKPNFNRWGSNRVEMSLGRFSSSPAANVPLGGAFRTASGPPTFTSAAHYNPNTGASSQPPKPLTNRHVGKFSAPPLRSLSQPNSQAKAAMLHKPFVPPMLQGYSQKPALVKTGPPPPPPASCPASNPMNGDEGLDRMKAQASEFMADLKKNIPEGLFDDLSDYEDPIEPDPSTSTPAPDPTSTRKRRKAAVRPTKANKKNTASVKRK